MCIGDGTLKMMLWVIVADWTDSTDDTNARA
jgi:hypothetical protein